MLLADTSHEALSFPVIIQEEVKRMNLDLQNVKAELLLDEGEKLTAYIDTTGHNTVGVGHLITNKDIIEIGDTISPSHKDRLLEQDIAEGINNCRIIYKDFDNFPSSAQEALLNMMFNMGIGNMASFHGFNDCVAKQDWGAVADYLRNNFKKWYAQVHDRALRVEQKFIQAARGI